MNTTEHNYLHYETSPNIIKNHFFKLKNLEKINFKLVRHYIISADVIIFMDNIKFS